MSKTLCEKCGKAKATLYSDILLLEPDVCGPCFRKITPVEVRMERAAQTTGMVRAEEADPDGIRKIHTDLLEIIRKNPGFTIVQLGAISAMPKPTVTRLVTDLRKAGAVKPAIYAVKEQYGRVFAMEYQCPEVVAVVSPESGPLTSGSIETSTEEMPEGPGNTITSVPASTASLSESARDVLTPDAPLADGPTGESAAAKPAFLSDTPVVEAAGSADTGEAEGVGELSCGSPALAVSPTSTLDAALLAAKELAEENAQLKAKLARIQIVADQNQKELNRTRHLLEILRREPNEAEDELAEISWVCRKVGYSGSGEVVDQFQWLLSQLGYPSLVTAMAARRRAQVRIREAEAEIERIEASMRIGVEPQTGDRCLCGREATKGESEEGFTICNECFAEGEE